MLADHDDREAIVELITETYRRLSTPGSDDCAAARPQDSRLACANEFTP